MPQVWRISSSLVCCLCCVYSKLGKLLTFFGRPESNRPYSFRFPIKLCNMEGGSQHVLRCHTFKHAFLYRVAVNTGAALCVLVLTHIQWKFGTQLEACFIYVDTKDIEHGPRSNEVIINTHTFCRQCFYEFWLIFFRKIRYIYKCWTLSPTLLSTFYCNIGTLSPWQFTIIGRVSTGAWVTIAKTRFFAAWD